MAARGRATLGAARGREGAPGRRMAKILIIADDLTGAADCGVVFAGRGMEAMVVPGRPGEDAAVCGPVAKAEVLAIDADTRGLAGQRAAEAVALIVSQYGDCGGLIFKKVDSTLRGNVAPELAAVLRAWRTKVAAGERVAMLFAPAFPAHGRTTVMGRQWVNAGHWKKRRWVAGRTPALVRCFGKPVSPIA